MTKRLSPLFTWRSGIAMSDLTSMQRLVAYGLSLYMSDRGDSCYPALTTIAKETALGLSTVRAAVVELERKGWLTREIGKGREGTHGHSNLYHATIPPGTGEIPEDSEEVTRHLLAESRQERATNPPTPGDESDTDHATTTPEPLAAATRPRDGLWDVCEELYGKAPTRKGLRGGWNEAVAQLREDGATAVTIRAWVHSLRPTDKAWAVATVMALAKHYHRLGPSPGERAPRGAIERFGKRAREVGDGLGSGDAADAEDGRVLSGPHD